MGLGTQDGKAGHSIIWVQQAYRPTTFVFYRLEGQRIGLEALEYIGFDLVFDC